MGNGCVTQKDIAEKLGVSINTVSRALRNSPEISEELKAKIKQLANEMGYIPNCVANFMRGGKTNFVGIVVNSFTNPYYTLCLDRLVVQLSRYDYSPFILASENNLFDYKTLTKLIMNHVCAVITFSEMDENVINYFEGSDMPIVSIGIPPQRDDIDAVFADDICFGQIAAIEYLKSNRTHPCYIGTDLKESSNLRKEKFISMLNENNINVDEYNVVFKDRESKAKELLDEFKKNKNDFFYCYNDEIASFVSEILEDNNIEGISIYGVDGTPKYLPICRKFNSIGYSFGRIVELCIQILFAKLKGDKKTYQIKYEPYLIYEAK